MLVNRAITGGFGATLLPGLALRDGVPPICAPWSSIPTLLTTPAAIDEQIERLEVHYLSNPAGEISLRAAVGLDGCRAEWLPRRRRPAGGGHGRHRAAQRPLSERGRRRSLPPAPSPPRSGTRRSAVDGLGAQARQAARAQPPAARRDRHDVPRRQAIAAVPADVRYVITLDADTRLPRDAVRRLVGKMAHPLNRPRFDPRRGRVVEGYGVLQPRVTPSLPVGAEGSLFQRIFSSNSGHRSLRVGGLRRLPGPVRRRLLHRQGHLRRRRLRGRAAGPRSRQARCSATTCSRASSRARAWSPTSKWSRSFPRATTWRRRASIAGRAATGSCCPGCSATWGRPPRAGRAGPRPLEDDRQPPPHPVGRRPCSSRCWRDGRCRSGRARLDGLRLLTSRCRRSCRCSPPCCRGIRHHAAQPFRARWRPMSVPVRRRRCCVVVSGPSGLADDRCDRPDAVSSCSSASAGCSSGSPPPRPEHAARRLDRFSSQMAGSLVIASLAALFVWSAAPATVGRPALLLAWLLAPAIARWVSRRRSMPAASRLNDADTCRSG